jgi:hypothetical protein
MVASILFLLFLSGLYPIGCAIRADWKTTLLHALFWALAAWFTWTAVAMLEGVPKADSRPARYLALAMNGCASIAILGARRPGVRAWNFVVFGLLVVMAFLWLESRLAPDDVILHRVRTILMASAIGIGALNYLPTRLAPAALMLALGAGLEIVSLTGSEPLVMRLEPARPVGLLTLALVPWVSFAQIRQRSKVRSEFDQTWLDFRDRFGFIWAQRLREQFNNSAAHADWPVLLRWQGLCLIPGKPKPDLTDQQAMLEALLALLKRFRS